MIASSATGVCLIIFELRKKKVQGGKNQFMDI